MNSPYLPQSFRNMGQAQGIILNDNEPTFEEKYEIED
jgi:hypothetical protein